MSFTSNFLKSLQEKGVSTTINAGGAEPSASSAKSTPASGGDDYTKNFFAALEKQNSMTISDKVTRRVSAMQKSSTPGSSMDVFNNAVRNSARATTSGGFYSRPTLDVGEKLYASVEALKPVLTEKHTSVKTARSVLDQARSDLQTVKSYLDEVKATYDQDPSIENADGYNQIKDAWNLAYRQYSDAFAAYYAAYDDYKPYEDELVNTLAAYQLFTNQQQSTLEDWRRTIRDTATIKQELDAIDAQIAELKKADTISGLKAFAGNMAAVMAASSTGLQFDEMQFGTDSTAQIRKLEAARDLLQEEYNWSQYYKYAELPNASDFADKSKYVSTANGQERSGWDIMLGNYAEGSSGWDDPLYEYINGNEAAGDYISNMASSAYGTDNALGAIFGRATESKAESQQMTEEEVATFNYLYATQGREAAHAYYEYLQSDLNYRQRQADEEYWADYAKRWPVLSSVFSTMISPTKGLAYIGQAADLMSDGTIDQNAAYNKYSYAGSAIRGQVAQEIENSGKWGLVGSFAYQTAMSMADFLMNTAITGGNQSLSLAIMGSGAAADATIAAKDRGLSDDRSFALGTVAGLAEIITEKVSLEALLNPNLLRNGSMQYIFKNILAEGSEEVGSDVINLFADILISKDQSEWQQSIDAYMRDGKTEEEAFGLAMADQAMSMGLDFLGGAISGGIMSGGAAIGYNNSTKKLGHQLETLDLDMDDIQAFIDTGLESDQDSDAYHIAVELQEKIDAGEQLTSEDLSRMYQANVQAVAEEADQEEEPEGLSLPTLEDDNENTVFDNANDQFVTQNRADVTVTPGNVPISVAERMRQEQTLNGGMEYERRTDLPDGSAERNDGQSAGEQVGRLAGGTEQHGRTYADYGRATVARQNFVRSLQLKKISSQELGLQNGTEEQTIQVVPQEHWDSEMSQVADRIYKETGKVVTYVMGRIQIRGVSGTVGYARGVITGDRIIVQADHLRLPIEQIADHEAYHAKVDYAAEYRLNLNTAIRQHIIETFTEEQFAKVLDKYIVALRGVYDVNSVKSREEYEEMIRKIEEEVYADAYAGINAFGANADQFTEAVNEKMGQYALGKQTDQDNGTEQPTGPPSDRYSYAGQNANTADLEALARAKEMEAAGVADETIRQQTGWHKGMDGLWRWEIDDSVMRYDSSGDLRGAESAKWAMEDYENAREDLWGHADMDTLEKVRAYNRADLAGDETAKQELYDELIDGPHAYYFGQYIDALEQAQKMRGKPKGGTLQDYIDHPALFEAYPQLREVGIRFEQMASDQGGYFDRLDNEIVLNETLKSEPEDVLVHEIQHAIQKAEGFARGSSPEFWENRQAGDNPVTEYGTKIRDGKAKMEQILNSLPDNIAEQFRQFSELDKTDPNAAMQIANELSDGMYGDQFNDYFMLEWSMDEWMKHDRRRGKMDLYRNTAGEIEARDVSARRLMDSETRRATKPAGADKDTVFAEDGDDLSLQLGERFSSDDTGIRYSSRDSNGNTLTAEQQEYFKDSEARDGKGQLLVLYHQTNADFTIFNTRHEGAGSRDNETPFGIFLKRSDSDIGLRGKKQMKLYANIANPLRVTNREDLVYRLRHLSPEYGTIADEIRQLDYEYHNKYEAARQALRDFMTKWRQENPGASRRALYDVKEFNALDDAEDDVIDEWTEKQNELSAKAKESITAALREAGYDGVFIQEDVGSWGRKTDAIIALDPEQVKNVTNKTPTADPDIRYSVDDDKSQQTKSQTNKPDAKKIRPVAESRPLIAKRDFRNTVFNLFSIPSTQRAELGTMIDSYADRLIKNGTLSEEDRRSFFDRMYESGVMTTPANEYYAEARSYMKGGKIYIPDRVVNDFGDDWNDIRRRAFAAGIYLTRSEVTDGHRNAGIDVWNNDLASELPGLFDSEETDERSILERIIQVAEEGKDEQLSLPEYTARLAQQEHASEEEFLDNMERQLDWALRTFAEKAKLEVHLRDRTGRKIAQEREGFAEKNKQQAERRRAREAQRRADERQARKESAQRARDRRELSELQQRTLKQLQWLQKNRHRAPEDQKEVWDEVLSDIDLYAVGAANEMRWSDKYNATWADAVAMYDKAKAEDPNFFELRELEKMAARLRNKKLADLDVDALNDLYRLVVGLRTTYYNRRNVLEDDRKRLFSEVYTDSVKELRNAPGGNRWKAETGRYEIAPGTGGKVEKFFNLDQLTPMNVLQRMAGWNPDSAFYSMAKQLERGERDIRAYTVKAQKMLQDFLTEHEDWVKIADGQGKDAIWYEVEIPELLALEVGKKPEFGKTIKVWMTPAQKVHMYLESRNQDNLRHMSGGRTFVDKEMYSQGKRKQAFINGTTVAMAPETVRAIVSSLTPEEMELAHVLDQYYNSFAAQEINRVSNILYGYDKAMGKFYAPIYTDQSYTKKNIGIFEQTAESQGNLKERVKGSKTPSYNISAFEAFEKSVEQNALFCGMAIPARNMETFLNWGGGHGTMSAEIAKKWGEEAGSYVTELVAKLQSGEAYEADTVSSFADKLQSNYISAVFGANPSIVLKQLGSIPLAGAYLDARNIPTPAQMMNIDRGLISKYTQELEWRTMGYTTPETKQLKDNPNWTQTNKTFKFVFGGGAITAMDGWAASTLWPWAENKVRREHPELEVGTKAQVESGESPFYKKVAEEFDNAVSRSQSVSDEIHQGRLRKSKNPITRTFTLFRSDSAQTYNTLRQKIGEAQFYARTGAEDKVLRTAKKAVGTAFMALLINAVWGESINFLMALWKNKAKRYRDDEDELTVESVTGEMVSGMLGSFAGVVTGGEELLEVIGNILTGDTLYDIETTGMEQLNDVIETVTTAGGNMRELVAGGWDIVKNGGDLGAYFGEHTGKILGNIKDLAVAAATYLPGLPASNLEAYLVGALKWISPEMGAAYDDLFADVGKNDLSGTEGGALVSRISGILSDRRISESEETAEALAALYEAGYKEAVPGDVPASISVNGESRKLGVYQQQTYGTIWGGIVADALDDLVSSDSFAEADQKTQAKMLNSLYSYAAEQAKAELFDDYEMDAGAVENAAIVAAGASVAECIAWNAITTGKDPDGTAKMKASEKAAELVSWDLPDEAKREIFRTKISDSREDTIDSLMGTGLSFNQFLQAYSKYSEINSMDLDPGQKAVEFSRWTNDQEYTSDQAAAVKEELVFFNMTPASASRFDDFVEAGMDADDAYNLNGVLDELQPEEGQETVSDLQKWRASVDFSDDVEDQLTALSMVMSDSQFMKVEIANDFGVLPDAYVTLQEIKPRFDADGNGSFKNAEIQAAIDSMSGHYTTEQKAVLWQLTTGSTSSKNNPYSRQVGQRVLDARAAAKEAAASQDESDSSGEYEDYSFSQAVLDQLLGRG